MPVYNYRTASGKVVEFYQRHDAKPLQVHPSTGEPVSRIYNTPAVIFRGSGFYTTDYKSSGAGSSDDNIQSS
jgi:predicted nucleic acid-binding Zn ribbon protein